MVDFSATKINIKPSSETAQKLGYQPGILYSWTTDALLGADKTATVSISGVSRQNSQAT